MPCMFCMIARVAVNSTALRDVPLYNLAAPFMLSLQSLRQLSAEWVQLSALLIHWSTANGFDGLPHSLALSLLLMLQQFTVRAYTDLVMHSGNEAIDPWNKVHDSISVRGMVTVAAASCQVTCACFMALLPFILVMCLFGSVHRWCNIRTSTAHHCTVSTRSRIEAITRIICCAAR